MHWPTSLGGFARPRRGERRHHYRAVRKMTEQTMPQRVLLAKVGLDGHDRGIKVVARGLRDAGFHVIYSGLWQSVESVVQAAQDEDVDWLGISILNGAHMTLVPALLELLRERNIVHLGVIVGGIIPVDDQKKLRELGVAKCFGPGTSIESIVESLASRAGRASSFKSNCGHVGKQHEE